MKMNRPLYNDQASQPIPYLTLRDTVSTVSKIEDGGDIFSKSRRLRWPISLAAQCNDYGESGGILIWAVPGQPSLPRRLRFSHGQAAEVELHSVSRRPRLPLNALVMCGISPQCYSNDAGSSAQWRTIFLEALGNYSRPQVSYTSAHPVRVRSHIFPRNNGEGCSIQRGSLQSLTIRSPSTD